MAKIDLIRERFKDKIKPIDFIEIASSIDNSKTKKYTEHIIRFTKNMIGDFNNVVKSEMEYVIKDLKKFDELSTNGMIENPDINQYKNISSIRQLIKEASLSKSISKAKKEIKVLYEDDKYMLFLPLSHDAASVYGRGTKWCVTQSDYFYRYTDRGILAYFIEKGINRKIGLYYDMDISYYYSVLNKEDEKKVLYENKQKVCDEEGVKYDTELMEIYDFSNKFSCWTDWDSRIDMMFIPAPLMIKELFINYCRENNIQNASLLDEVETENIVKYFKNNERYHQELTPVEPPTVEMEMYVGGEEPTDMEPPIEEYNEAVLEVRGRALNG